MTQSLALKKNKVLTKIAVIPLGYAKHVCEISFLQNFIYSYQHTLGIVQDLVP